LRAPWLLCSTLLPTLPFSACIYRIKSQAWGILSFLRPTLLKVCHISLVKQQSQHCFQLMLRRCHQLISFWPVIR
jgi:hypothetical protein